MKLSALQCKNAIARDKAYKLTDGDGLYLEVSPTGKKYWRFQYRYGGKRPRLSFGVFPEVTLQEARDRRDASRKLLREGINPGLHQKKERLRRVHEGSNTFEKVAQEWHANRSAKWSEGYAQTTMSRLSKYVFPELGNYPIRDLTAPDILTVIKKIDNRGAHDMAYRVLQYVGQVCRYAIATGRADIDPTYRLTEALTPHRQEHLAALDIRELPAFLQKLRRNEARLFPQTILATELLMLTFVRTIELIGARWEEFDLAERQWLIPASRMKMRKEHLVPLSDQVIAKLEQLRQLNPNSEYVFPHSYLRNRHISNCTIMKGIHRIGYAGRMTGHGFRALAMTTIKEKLGYRHEVIDRQLAHQPRSKVDRAYDRAQFFDERRVMMQRWADYIDSLMAG